MLLSVGIGIVLFLCAFLGFREGLRLGMKTSKGVEPQPIKNPVQMVMDTKKTIEQSKADKLLEEGLRNIFSYTGDKE